MNIPAFCEENFFSNTINNNSKVITIENVKINTFSDYISLFKNDGYCEKERREISNNLFCSLKKGNEGAFINYYSSTNELTIVLEENSKYFEYSDQKRKASVAPQITQIPLEDFGMSYVIRLSDGRFIIIDGGREFEPDAMRLFECLKRSSNGEKPIIAAWILTHPHSDHFHCYIKFMDMYQDAVEIEKYLFTFPEHDDLVHYPAVMNKDRRFEDSSIYTNIPFMLERMERSGAPIYSPHTGQRYVIGDAVCDVLGSIDDTIHRSTNVNSTSLVIRMELGGQIILWGADACFSELQISEKYGSYLKADILQVPHHGFQSGTAEAEISAYKVIRPAVCLLPVSDYNAFTVFCTYRAATRFLMQDAGVLEMISGDTERTLTLPYTARLEGKAELERKFLTGINSSGSRAWIFTDLDTSKKEDFEFSILNTTNFPATVWIELFFENRENNVRSIKAAVPQGTFKKISIIGDEIDGDALYFNWMSLKALGVPENSTFAVRFICENPIVVSHKNHSPAYQSSYNA